MSGRATSRGSSECPTAVSPRSSPGKSISLNIHSTFVYRCFLITFPPPEAIHSFSNFDAQKSNSCIFICRFSYKWFLAKSITTSFNHFRSTMHKKVTLTSFMKFLAKSIAWLLLLHLKSLIHFQSFIYEIYYYY